MTTPSCLVAALSTSLKDIAYCIALPSLRGNRDSSFLRRLEAPPPPRQSVSEGSEPEWRIHTAIAAILVLDSVVIGIAPSGPWDDSGFSRGVIGLVGMSLAYVAWYRVTFKRRGLIPWLDQWEDPKRTAKVEMMVAALVLAIAWVAGNPLQPYLPDPTGLLLALVGLLIALQSAYVMLSIGPLRED